MKKSYGILFTRKTGKVVRIVEGISQAMLKMYGLNNTSPSRDYMVVDTDGVVVFYCEGKKNDMPTVKEEYINKPSEEFGFSILELTENPM